MKKLSSKSNRKTISSLLCHFFGHHYVLSKKVTEHIKEYKCVHCNKEVSTDGDGKISELTFQMREINNTLEDMYKKRRPRSLVKK